MADIALTTANTVAVVESIEQATAPAGVAITAGQAVRLDTTTGKWALADAGTAPNARIYGLATRTVLAGMALTAIRKGVMDGFAITALAFDLPIFLSNTAGALADAAGTVSTVVGRVIGGYATTLGTVADRLLFVDL